MAQKHLVENLSADIMTTSQVLLVPTLTTGLSPQHYHPMVPPGSLREDLDMRALSCLTSWTASA